jgi:type IV secretory pathway VirB6-like protein
MIHNILDYQGNKIGELDDTGLSEAQVTKKLTEYAQAPAAEIIHDVTPRQIRQALILSGVSMASIESALDTLSEPTKSLAKAEWEYSISFQRNRPLVAQVGQLLGWSNAQLDALWKFAASL